MYKLYYVPNWASLVVRIVLESHDIPYEAHLLNPEIDLNSAWYRGINPCGLVPALQTPEGSIFETAAILLWLAERHEGIAPGVGSRERAEFLTWLLFTSNTLHTTVMRLINPQRIAGEEQVEFVMQQAQRDLRLHLDRVELQRLSPPGSPIAVPFFFLPMLACCCVSRLRTLPSAPMPSFLRNFLHSAKCCVTSSIIQQS